MPKRRLIELTEIEKEDIADQIAIRGFDIYFVESHAGRNLSILANLEIKAYLRAREDLMTALESLGIKLG